MLHRNEVAVMEQKKHPQTSMAAKEPIFSASTPAGRKNWRSSQAVSGAVVPQRAGNGALFGDSTAP
jgi:hypothetical protein